MSEEILFNRSMIDQNIDTRGGRFRGSYTGFDRDRDRYPNTRGGGGGLNPRARSFFTTYPMADSLPILDPPEFRLPPPKQRVRIEAPPGPVPSQVAVRMEPKANRSRHDTPPHLHRPQNQSNSGAMTIRPSPSRPPISRFQEIPSTTFHVGPLPPTFTIEQIHHAMKALNPRVALIDLRSGIMEIEIPFTLTWSQISDWCARGLKIGDLIIPVKSAVSTTPERPLS